MSIQKNINDNLNDSFKNTNYLPQKLLLEDVDRGMRDFIVDLGITIEDADGKDIRVPVIFLTQERWAEFKMNWKFLKDESGEEIRMPFMTMRRKSVKRGTSPLKRTIPKKLKFTYCKVPTTDGVLAGYEIFKIPQPTWVDVDYELRFVAHYMQDVNISYEKMLEEGFSDGQGYMKINGYNIPSVLGDPSEDNTVDSIDSDRFFQLVYPLTVHSRIVDPKKFERVQTITKISIQIQEDEC
jgi:hypothetical protein